MEFRPLAAEIRALELTVLCSERCGHYQLTAPWDPAGGDRWTGASASTTFTVGGGK